MSEGTTFTPDYGLSEYTRKAVKNAGVGGEAAARARKHLQKGKTIKDITGAVDTVGKEADKMVGRIKANNAAKGEAEEKAKLALENAQDEGEGLLAPKRKEAEENTLMNRMKGSLMPGSLMTKRDEDYMAAVSPAPMLSSPAKSLSGLSEVHDSQSEELPAFDETDLNWREGFLR